MAGHVVRVGGGGGEGTELHKGDLMGKLEGKRQRGKLGADNYKWTLRL